jgi:hypothetical protein
LRAPFTQSRPECGYALLDERPFAMPNSASAGNRPHCARGRQISRSGSGAATTGELIPDEAEQAAIAETLELHAWGLSLRAIAAEMQAKGFQISHEGVARIRAA